MKDVISEYLRDKLELRYDDSTGGACMLSDGLRREVLSVVKRLETFHKNPPREVVERIVKLARQEQGMVAGVSSLDRIMRRLEAGDD